MERWRYGLAFACFAAGLFAADLGKELLDAAAQGHATAVQDLLAKGAPLESKDKNGRTPLILAAQRGHVAAVHALLKKGADPSAKDQTGATAWILATFAPAGNRDGNQEVLKLLPHPPRPKLSIETAWNPGNLYNSCVMRLDQLTGFVGELQPDLLALSALRRYIGISGKDLVELAATNARGVGAPGDEAFSNADAVLILTVRPGAACVPQQSADRLDLTLELQMLRARDKAVLLRKTVGGGGLKALHARMVTAQPQYFPVYEEWIQADIQQVYWAAVEAWYRAG